MKTKMLREIVETTIRARKEGGSRFVKGAVDKIMFNVTANIRNLRGVGKVIDYLDEQIFDHQVEDIDTMLCPCVMIFMDGPIHGKVMQFKTMDAKPAGRDYLYPVKTEEGTFHHAYNYSKPMLVGDTIIFLMTVEPIRLSA